jgi:hypothetical protein
VLAIFALVTLFMGLLPARAQAAKCKIVMAQTGCDVCRNNCCYDHNSDMESCRVIRRLCRVAGDLESCNAMCRLDYQNCK